MHSYDVIELTQNLIRYPSVTPESDDIIAYMKTYLSSLGFTTQIMTFQTEGRPPVSNLFARYGTESPHLCFAGHVDVVPVGNLSDWKHPPFEAQIEKHILYGRGAVDMKGAIAAFMAAVASKLAAGPVQGSISLLITGDEEGDAVDGTVRVLKELQQTGQIPDICLVGEPTSEECVGDTIKIGRRGSLSGHLVIHGKQGHVAYPHRAVNPVRQLVNFLDQLQSIVWDKGSDNFDPSNLEVTSVSADNIAVNVIPQNAYALFNIRYNNLHSRDQILERIQDLAVTHCPDHELTFTGNAEPFLNPSAELIELTVGAVETVLSKKPKTSTSGGTSDARFIHSYCPVVELGLMNHTAHQVDEHAALDDLKTLERIYKAILDRLFS